MILSFLSGSMVMALFLWLQIPALSANGFLYVESFSYITLMILGIPAMGTCWWFIKLIRKERGHTETFGTAELVLGEVSYSFRALVDTGNGLRDPMTGKMVILLDEKGRNRIDSQELYRENRAVLIPYRAVGTERGVLNGIRIDGLRFQEKEWSHVVVAFYDGKFDGYEVLLNQEILEGGLLEHG